MRTGFKIFSALMELNGILVGLGNPGPQYVGTRHNMGFSVIQCVLEHAEKSGLNVDMLSGAKFKALLWKIHFGRDNTWLVAAPQTYMNASGEAVQALLSWNKISPEKLLVVHDELDLPPGRIKLQLGGNPAGHNGLKSIQQLTGTSNFYRLRIGIGRPPDKDNVISWVLGRFSTADKTIMEQTFPRILEAINTFIIHGSVRALNFANCKNNRIN